MGKRQARHGRSRPTATGGDGPSGFNVLIGADGTAALEGEPVPVPEGQLVHIAVLDMLQGFAEAQAAPVEAAVTDQRAGYAVRIQVDPDGSSRLVGHDEDEQLAYGAGPDHAAYAATAHATSPVAPAPQAPPGRPDGLSGAGQAVPHDLPGVRPERPAAQQGPQAASGPAGPTTVLSREELDEALAFINEAIAAGELERAGVLTSRLREHTAYSQGAEHPYTLRTHEIESHLAYLRGDQQSATAISLSVARIRQRQGDPAARENLTRAASTWWLLSDARATLNYGSELMTLWTQLVSSGNGGAGDEEMLDRVRERMKTVANSARRG